MSSKRLIINLVIIATLSLLEKTASKSCIYIFLSVFLLHFCFLATIPRKSRDFGNGSPVCVCNEEYCDTITPVEPVEEKQAVICTSDKSGRRLERTIANIVPLNSGELTFNFLFLKNNFFF